MENNKKTHEKHGQQNQIIHYLKNQNQHRQFTTYNLQKHYTTLIPSN